MSIFSSLRELFRKRSKTPERLFAVSVIARRFPVIALARTSGAAPAILLSQVEGAEQTISDLRNTFPNCWIVLLAESTGTRNRPEHRSSSLVSTVATLGLMKDFLRPDRSKDEVRKGYDLILLAEDLHEGTPSPQSATKVRDDLCRHFLNQFGVLVVAQTGDLYQAQTPNTFNARANGVVERQDLIP
jgi:hypothetical protein